MARVEIYQPKTDRFAQRLARERVKKLVEVVALEARRHASRYTGNSVPTPDGSLARSIKSSVRRSGPWKVVGKVGSDHPKALLVHNGAKPHIIRPVNAGGLKFFWKEKGKFVCIKTPINHPGMQGKFFLTNPLRIEGRAQGFRTVISVETERLFR